MIPHISLTEMFQASVLIFALGYLAGLLTTFKLTRKKG